MSFNASWQENPSCPLETSVLRRDQLADWDGLRLGIFRAVSHEHRRWECPNALLAMILKGRTRSRMDMCGRELNFDANAAALGLLPAGTSAEYVRWDCGPAAERLMVEHDFREMRAAGDLEALKQQDCPLPLRLGFADRQLGALLQLVVDEVRAGSPHGGLYATSLSLTLVSYLYAHHASASGLGMRERAGLSRAQKASVLDYIQAHLSMKIELADLAVLAGMSRFHFLRLFKNTFSVTPHRYVQDLRLAAARELLEGTLVPLAQVAAATGFSSQSHLSGAMRQATGTSPGQWRRRHASQEQV